MTKSDRKQRREKEKTLQVSASVFEEKEGGGGLEERIAMMESKIDRSLMKSVVFAMMMHVRDGHRYAQAARVDGGRSGCEEAGSG
jgi:hypothetical protein